MKDTTAREMASSAGWDADQVLGAWYDWFAGGKLASVGLIKGQGGASGTDVNELAWLRVIGTPGWCEAVEAAFVDAYGGRRFSRFRFPLSDPPEKLRRDFTRRLAISLLSKPFIPAVVLHDGTEGTELAIAQLQRKGLRIERAA